MLKRPAIPRWDAANDLDWLAVAVAVTKEHRVSRGLNAVSSKMR